jgi:Putative restriction endonuclease
MRAALSDNRVMPTTLMEIPARPEPRRKRWTRVECDALVELGLLDGQKLELVEGELIDKMGKNQPHVMLLAALHDWLRGVFGARRVLQEAPIDVAPEDNPTSEPEPDLIVLKSDRSHFTKEKPRPEDLDLVVEVADSTLYFDLTTKASLYARASIADYWVLDVSGRRMIVHRDPREGRFESVLVYGSEESVAPLAAPGTPLRIVDVLVE